MNETWITEKSHILSKIGDNQAMTWSCFLYFKKNTVNQYIKHDDNNNDTSIMAISSGVKNRKNPESFLNSQWK